MPWMKYPGDSREHVTFTTGAAFRAAHPDRAIVITIDDGSSTRIPVEDVVCDLCNAAIADDDPCTLEGTSRLLCANCTKQWITPYLLP